MVRLRAPRNTAAPMRVTSFASGCPSATRTDIALEFFAPPGRRARCSHVRFSPYCVAIAISITACRSSGVSARGRRTAAARR